MDTAPRNQIDFIGHDDAEQQIVQAISGGRMPHAWLITGPDGVGKATFAFRFARFLLSGLPLKNTLAVPADHPTTKLISAGSHPDLLVIERAFDEKKGRMLKNIPVDEIRRIAPFLGMTASQGAWRVAIVDGADTLSTQAQNAILKTLEEPPEKSVLLLTAENGARLLPTIRSRCRILKMDKLSLQHLAALAEKHGLKSEGQGAQEFLLALADGSAARLLRYGTCDAFGVYQSWLAFLADPFNPLLRLKLAESWSARDNEALYETGLDVMRDWLRRLIMAKGLNKPPVALMSDENRLVAGLYPTLRLDCLLALWENLHAQMDAVYASNLDHKTALMGMLDETATALNR